MALQGRLNNNDLMSEAELIAAGADKTKLPNDTKAYVSANSINKTLSDALTDGSVANSEVAHLMAQISTPGNPAANYNKLYFKADGNLYMLDSAGVESQVNLGGGSSEFSTGDIKTTIKTVATTGWVLMNDGTIGDAASGATTRANADCQALFELMWNNITNTWAPVVGGRGASANADWLASKQITLPKALGRALGVSGAGSGLTGRALGETLGEETHALSTAELATHTHTQNAHNHGITDPGHIHSVTTKSNPLFNPLDYVAYTQGENTVSSFNTNSATTGITINNATATNQNAGSGTAHNNMQPSLFVNIMIKL